MASCSHWWHAPIYFTVSVVLAFIAISTALNSQSRNATSLPPPSPNHAISHNATAALRRSGFNIIATLLSIYPEIFLSSPNSTIFAIQDSALTNASDSLPPWFLKHLFRYHTSPSVFSMADLLSKPQGSCFPTLFQRKNVSVTKVDANERFLEINHVLVSHPDIFLRGNIAIHGVIGPFSSMNYQGSDQNPDSIQAPVCDSNGVEFLATSDPKNMVEWTRIVRLLSSNGYVSFAIGLSSVLDGIIEDYGNLNSVTIFSPPELAVVASPSPMLDKIVRLHILPLKITFTDLASMPDNSLVSTLLPSQQLQIISGHNMTRELTINGVEIIEPEILSSDIFIIHGISQAFEVADIPSSVQKSNIGVVSDEV